jgi:hypothetical protein
MTKRWIAACALLLLAGRAIGADDFHCLEGARDPAPYKPGNVVRWCEIEKDGRPVYHGSVWRWYRSGQLAGKEFYVYGNAEGEWPSWYENGKPSSLGSFKGGNKVGLWRYWDEAGHLKTEVTYGSSGNDWTEYYPSGQKKAHGLFVETGKIGAWTYWATDGNQIARCDFGQGLLSLASPDCKTIAETLDPKGFSPPIPSAAISAPSRVTLTVGSEVFRLLAPLGWVADVAAGKEEQVPVVFYPTGGAWRGDGPNMYIRVLFRAGRSFSASVSEESASFADDVADYAENGSAAGKLANGRATVTKTISYKPLTETDSPFSIVGSNTISERISYLDASDNLALMVVLTRQDGKPLGNSLSALKTLVDSIR